MHHFGSLIVGLGATAELILSLIRESLNLFSGCFHPLPAFAGRRGRGISLRLLKISVWVCYTDSMTNPKIGSCTVIEV